VTDMAMLNLVALSALLMCWLFGFGWLSRKFERQADLFGIRCITPDIQACTPKCPIHGQSVTGASPAIEAVDLRATPLCVSAANLFGRTLSRIADLNGIARQAASWRHGSIQSRCRLIELHVADPGRLRSFDRRLLAIKITMAISTLIATAAAVWLYYPLIYRALRLPGLPPA